MTQTAVVQGQRLEELPDVSRSVFAGVPIIPLGVIGNKSNTVRHSIRIVASCLTVYTLIDPLLKSWIRADILLSLICLTVTVLSHWFPFVKPVKPQKGGKKVWLVPVGVKPTAKRLRIGSGRIP